MLHLSSASCQVSGVCGLKSQLELARPVPSQFLCTPVITSRLADHIWSVFELLRKDVMAVERVGYDYILLA
jgi:hypothetical protein